MSLPNRSPIRPRRTRIRLVQAITGLLLALPAAARSQQIVDSSFQPPIPLPTFTGRAGPIVAIDAGHDNFHTARGRYRPFAAVLERDGYRVREHGGSFTTASLRDVHVLVIANAGMPDGGSWSLPARSAFSLSEIEVLIAWIRRGGALLLIADHMPAGGAAADLARPFGAELTNGYTMQPRVDDIPGDRFTRAEGTLLAHPITDGHNRSERVDSVVTFVGQAFQIIGPLDVLLRFGPSASTLLPIRAPGGLDSLTPRVASGGWAHAAARQFGRGRVVLMGEAGAFTAQLAGPTRRPMGLNHPQAAANLRFLLNVMHWLSPRRD